MARAIKSPGVQIIETDLSNYQEVGGGTTIYLAGFAPQGPTEETLLVTTIAEFEQIYGTPETGAERYFYHSAREILNSPASLLTTRLPYGSGLGEGYATQYSALLFPALSSGNTFNLEKPTHITLTDAQYEKLLQGDVTWSTVMSSTTGTTVAEYNDGVNIEAGLIVVNTSKTAQNERFEGYYISVTDNAEFGPLTDFTAITNFYGLTSNSTGVNYFTVPTSRLGFALSATKDSAGSGSLSEIVEGAVDYNLNQTYYNDTLVLNLYRMRSSIYEPQTLSYSLIETHLGSLDAEKRELAPIGGIRKSFYLETTINNNSKNLKVFVNPNISRKTKWTDPDKAVRISSDVKAIFPNSVYQPTYDLNTKNIGNVVDKLSRVLSFVETTETTLLDVLVDGGLTTVSVNSKENNGYFEENVSMDTASLSSASNIQVQNYKTIFDVYANFAQNIRKDCVFIADPLRQVFVNGMDTKVYNLKNSTFSQNIYKPLQNLFESANSNYCVTYGNWVKSYDPFIDRQVWLPVSGWAAAAYARTDANAQPWIAPAGLNRGTIRNIVDLAFNPNQKQRDFLYTISVNPVVFFSGDGYTIFGQKTLQNKPSAFDRVNVRRLFLTLERATQNALNYFVFEPNTEFTRTRVKSTISPIFELAKNTDGVYDYLLVCDERNNTPDVIDRNELVVDIYIKPVKAAEFILVNFIATRTGQNFQELI
jgi:hypothetical protein